MSTIKNLAIFSTITLLSGWVGYAIDQNIDPQPGEETLGMLFWLVVPLLTAFMIRFFSRDWSNLALQPDFLKNLKWYVVAFIVFPSVTFSVVSLGNLLGWISFSQFNSKTYFTGVLVALLPNFIKNIFEEFVWRGYLTSKLLNTNLSDLGIYLIVGAVWGAWHIPYYLFFLDESVLSQVLAVGRIPFTLIAIATMIAWTLMYVELFRITKTIWPVVILHMVEDSVINHLVLDKHIIIHKNTFLISPICGVITTLIYLGIGLMLRRQRIKSGL